MCKQLLSLLAAAALLFAVDSVAAKKFEKTPCHAGYNNFGAKSLFGTRAARIRLVDATGGNKCLSYSGTTLSPATCDVNAASQIIYVKATSIKDNYNNYCFASSSGACLSWGSAPSGPNYQANSNMANGFYIRCAEVPQNPGANCATCTNTAGCPTCGGYTSGPYFPANTGSGGKGWFDMTGTIFDICPNGGDYRTCANKIKNVVSYPTYDAAASAFFGPVASTSNESFPANVAPLSKTAPTVQTYSRFEYTWV